MRGGVTLLKTVIFSAVIAFLAITAVVFCDVRPLVALAPEDLNSPLKIPYTPSELDVHPAETPQKLNIPPVVETVPVLLFSGEQISSCAFYQVPYENRCDHIGLTSDFLQIPDWQHTGTQSVDIRVSDVFDSYTYITAELTIAVDTTPPVITGARDLTFLVNTPAAFRTGITVTDDLDPDPRLHIDASNVDLNTAGTYPLTYTATDRAGNTSQVTVRVSVINITVEDLHRLADTRLAQLRVFNTDDPLERVRLIHRYIRHNMEYVRAVGPAGHSDEHFAYVTLRNMRGNCIASQRVSEILLERAGIENIRIQNTDNTHSWNLILMDGVWYHYDATWFNNCRYRHSYMFTNETAELISPDRNDRYHFDASLYPPIA
jgi:hypothetical protein